MPTTIRIDDDVNAYIREQGKFGESYSDVLRRLLPGFESTQTTMSHQQNGQVEELAGSEGSRSKLFGHSVCAVIRWMGHDGWKFADARKVLNSYGLEDTSDTTIRCQLPPGKRGTPAKLSEEVSKELRDRKLK